MLEKIIIFYCVLCTCTCIRSSRTLSSVTGYMTEVQSWVNDIGILTTSIEYENAIDLSSNPNPVPILQQKLTDTEGDHGSVRYLSMARCNLTEVPMVFLLKDGNGQLLAETLEYLTFYGNPFFEANPPKQQYEVNMNATDYRKMRIDLFKRQLSWSGSLKETDFPHLKELDLRACSIKILSDNIFIGIPHLQALYIGENEIYYISTNAFAGLHGLLHMDFSRNFIYSNKNKLQSFMTENVNVFEPLKNMVSLDMSFTKLPKNHEHILNNLGPKLLRLSLCKTGLTYLENGIFNRTSLKILDISENYGIFEASTSLLAGLENTLEVLYARNTGLMTMYVVQGFEHLEVLDLSQNEISTIDPQVSISLKNLMVLDLDMNRMTLWFSSVFSLIPNLGLLSLRNNYINLVTEELIEDVSNVQFLAMSGNSIVCNCHARNFYDIGLRNENYSKQINNYITGRCYPSQDSNATFFEYHRGFLDFKTRIDLRSAVLNNNNSTEDVYEFNEDVNGNYLLIDYVPESYKCLLAAENTPIDFSEVERCKKSNKEIEYDNVIEENKKILYILFALPGILIILVLVFTYRRNFRYCLITIKNSTMLGLIHNSDFVDDNTIFHYDVFVSYCNEDRGWVLEHLLPHLEADCSISACLHERDFQVGHSILENIASCMDRSRSIMLVISRQFLLSQWCQFEMHLAQHRLLETRREDLTLVLLEEVPRRLRPTTLHYLMMTKTYILWPKDDNERAFFWRRVKKTLLNMKHKSSIERVSLA